MSHYPCPHPRTRQRLLFTARDYISADEFSVVVCLDCRVARTEPAPDPAQLARFYPRGYYGRDRRYNRFLELLLDRLYAWRAQHIERVTGLTRGRVLDIGCGRGQLLHQLRRRGWQVSGTELSEESADYARSVLNLDVQVCDVVDLCLPDESLDLVVLWHVLEHIADPTGLLKEVTRLLRPGGVVLVAVPNFASPEARWAKSSWFHLDVPRHVQHFGTGSLRSMLDGVGLHVFHSSFLAPEYDVFSFVQTAQNVLGVRHNLLYNLLRTRGAKLLDESRLPDLEQAALALLLAPLLGLVSLAWVPLAALSGRGATVTLYARKR